VVFRDISERKESHRNLAQAFHDMAEINNSLDKARNQLQQSEKMAAIGQLAAGMAHEINNPIGFLQSNLGSLEKYVLALLSLIAQYDEIEEDSKIAPALLGKINNLKKVIDFDFMREDLADLLVESRNGIDRVRKIVQALREFSQDGQADEWTWLDIPQSIENVLGVIHREFAGKCSLRQEYGKTPEIYCLPSQINYVFMSILVNAAQAIEISGEIVIRTGTEDDSVWVEIADTGTGIPDEILPRIFEPFFTTKPVGKGSGMGLATAYGIIKAHGGKIEVASVLGKGTAFVVRLPVKHLDPEKS
ncbi:MAG: ATP-binding protein, partial [Formivibrio sp.]|nr:ATP-binding protein [Formivibrio sp.]